MQPSRYREEFVTELLSYKGVNIVFAQCFRTDSNSGSKGAEVTRDWRELYNKELNFYPCGVHPVALCILYLLTY
jgi:hypothetical protein